MTRTYRLRWLFFLAFIVASGTSLWLFVAYSKSPAGRYARERDGNALMAVLTLEMKNGESQASVVRKLGEGHAITDSAELAAARETVLQNEQLNPAYCPDGLEPADIFIRYYFEPGGAMRLQFRDGRLVNFIVSEQTANFFRAQLGN